jgi:hypothetical protein
MKEHPQLFLSLKDRRGVTAIVVGIIIIILFGFVALAVDIGYVMVTRNELQNIADAAALGATRKLGTIYEPMSYAEHQNYVCDPSTIIAVGKEVALKNQAAGQNITINDEDIKIGRWDSTNKTLTTTLEQPDAVSVIARRDRSANGPIITFFARILGIDNVDVSAKATAALTGISRIGSGGLPIPVGISKEWFEKPEFCNQPIKFYPTGTLEGCAGWHTYDSKTHSASQLRSILEGLKNGTYQSPETIAGVSEFNFTGGDVASAFDEMKALFDAMKILNDGNVDSDNDPTTWTTNVVVYDRDDCSNPQNEIKIVGFATVKIIEVMGPSPKIINAEVKCEDVEQGRGSGEKYGTKGSIPGLVE